MIDSPPIDAVDASMCDRVQRRRMFYNDTDQTVTNQAREDEPSEKLMSQLDPYIGDGQARLTVSGSISSSHEYHKAEAFVSISVACNNSMDDVQMVHDIVKGHVQELVKEDHYGMSQLRDTVLPPDKRLHGSESSPPVEKSAPTGLPPVKEKGKVSRPPKRGSLVTPKGGKPKPTLKR